MHKLTSDKKPRLQVKVFANDGVWVNGPHLLSVTRLEELLTYATKKLELTWAARAAYTKPEGKRIRRDDELKHGMEVVVSSGEEFRPFNIQAKAKSRKMGNTRPNAPMVRGPENATGSGNANTRASRSRNSRRNQPTRTPATPPPPPANARPGPAPARVVPI